MAISLRSSPILPQLQNKMVGRKTLLKSLRQGRTEIPQQIVSVSNFKWGKKEEKINVDLDWSTLDKAKPYSPASKKACFVLQRNITSFCLQ